MFFTRGVAISGLCAAALMVGGLAGCGGDDGTSEEELQQAREEGEQAARDRDKLSDLERKLNERERNKDSGGGSSESGGGGGGGGTPPPTQAPSGGTDCGGGVRAGPNTSCPFARSVQDAYASGGGESQLQVYSSVTDREYTMTCSHGSPHVCTGGNNASVTFP
jgi:hypothetical protein